METIVKPVSLKWADIRLYKPVIHFITFSIWLMQVLEIFYPQVNRAVFVISHCAVYISVQLVLEVFNTRAETPVSTQTQHSWKASIKNVILLQHRLDKFQYVSTEFFKIKNKGMSRENKSNKIKSCITHLLFSI